MGGNARDLSGTGGSSDLTTIMSSGGSQGFAGVDGVDGDTDEVVVSISDEGVPGALPPLTPLLLYAPASLTQWTGRRVRVDA